MAPRISPRLIEVVLRFDDRTVPIAETYRRVGAEAERLGLTRPSYQRIRVLVHEARNATPRLTVSDVVRLLTAPLKSPEDGLQRLELLGLEGIAGWAGVPKLERPP